jgi:hypothetical protein
MGTDCKSELSVFGKYFSQSFPDTQKTFKKIKKAQSKRNYELAVKEIFSSKF